MSAPVREQLDLIGEVTLGGQAWSARNRLDVDEEAATRRSSGALLFRYVPRPSRLLVGLVGGFGLSFDDVRGLNHVKGVLVPAGGAHPIHELNLGIGVTVGADLERAVGRSMTVRVPVRVTRRFGYESGAYIDSTLDVQAGVDVTFRLFHRVSFR